jgi:Na+-translocating ferredoxin:NAD+ oxidoreductase subunit B
MTHTITDQCTGCTACLKICPVTAITGERKVLHVIAPALCIDCGACGRICPVDAVNDALGQPVIHTRRTQWPRPVVKAPECISCMVCLQSCPVNCLDWGKPDPESHRAIPVLHAPALCIGCAFCDAACPVDAIEMQVPQAQTA